MCKLSKEVELTRDEFFILTAVYKRYFDLLKEVDQLGCLIKSLLEKGLIVITYSADRYAVLSDMKPLVCRFLSLIDSSLPGIDREDFHSVKFCHIDGVLDTLSVQYWDGFEVHTKDLYVSESSEVYHAEVNASCDMDELNCDTCGYSPFPVKEETDGDTEKQQYELESPTQVSDNHYRKMKIQATDIAEQIMENNLAVPVKSRYLVCMGIKHLIRLGLKKDNDWEKELKKSINYFVRALTGKWAWQVDLNELFERVK